jgi:hypothetical protein
MLHFISEVPAIWADFERLSVNQGARGEPAKSPQKAANVPAKHRQNRS